MISSLPMSGKAAPRAKRLVIRLYIEKETPFGMPVLPEVNMVVATAFKAMLFLFFKIVTILASLRLLLLSPRKASA